MCMAGGLLAAIASDGYELGDSVLGTALMGVVAGLFIGVVTELLLWVRARLNQPPGPDR